MQSDFRISAFPGLPSEAVGIDPSGDFFLSADWFNLLAKHGMPANSQPRTYLATDFGDGMTVALFMAAEGRRLKSLTSFYTMRYSPAMGAPSLTALDDLARTLAAERWPVIEMRCLSPAMAGALADALKRARMVVQTYHQSETWYHPTIGMDARIYFEMRPSLRDKLERESRRFGRKHKVAFRVYTDDTGLADYQRVYDHSWKQSEQFPAFIPALVRTAAGMGILRLGVLYADNLPVAAQLWLLSGRQATIYKLAYDEAFAKLSVGGLLSKLMFTHVLDNDRPDEIDYGTGSDAYKRDWMSHKRDLIGLVAYNPATVSGLIGAAKTTLARVVRPTPQLAGAD